MGTWIGTSRGLYLLFNDYNYYYFDIYMLYFVIINYKAENHKVQSEWQ